MDTNYTIMAATTGADETRAVGSALASCLAPGDVVLLSGDLGAGKTQFVQGVAAGLSCADVPTSPTFNIVLTYDGAEMPLHHFDLYRLDDERQLDDIGMREYLEGDGACFVEWAEKFPGAFDDHLAVRIEKTSDEGRVVSAKARGARFRALLDAWKGALGTRLSKNGGVRAIEGAGVCGGGSGVEKGGGRAADDHVGRFASPVVAPDGYRGEGSAGPGRYVLAFDTANEVVAIGLGSIDAVTRDIRVVATREVAAHRASNTQLLAQVDDVLAQAGVTRAMLACVCVGRGPGSFTGVRIAMATAKGIASALGVGLVGVSSLDAIALNAQAAGARGQALVIADAMRKEVYPVRYELTDEDARRAGADRVVKAEAFAKELADAFSEGDASSRLLILGDGLVKYRDLYEELGTCAPEVLWSVSGRGLLLALQKAYRAGEADLLDVARHDPAWVLPVYTRLSDAEESERARLARDDAKNLVTGVQDVDGGARATMHGASRLVAPANADGVAYRPLDAARVGDVAALERKAMGTDAWSERLVADELGRKDRSWWIAEVGGSLAGYAGGMVVDGDLQVLKVAVASEFRRRGIARELVARVADDARNLGARTCSLEVRAGNVGAQGFYRQLGLDAIGRRPRYYSDREDALIMQGALPVSVRDVAGMQLMHHEAAETRPASGDMRERDSMSRPLILAIESSCDETAAALVDGAGDLLSDVVASQIDFHARFGGVVPEIASRKHIEAICGVCEEALATPRAAGRAITWGDLDAIAVTYAPGLVGALVVGVAFGKGAAWALDVPFIGVNHLEGHLYANKIGRPDFCPPAVVSLVSGGNTMLVHMRDWGDYETLGSTIDDAVGEAFDKVAKALGLGYPGGPVISRMAAQGDSAAIDFPRAMLHSHDLRFSLSGLKTAVVNYINKERSSGRELSIPDIAASFQQAVIDVQVAKAKTALLQTGAPTFCLGGGVAANPALRQAYEELCCELGVSLVMPPLASCGDNAGMIALVALDRYAQGRFFDLTADAYAHADLDEPY